MNVARKEFYTDFIAENSSDRGKLFRVAKKLLAKKEVPSFPQYVDNSALVNNIGRYFIRKINTIRSSIDAASDPSVGALLPDDPVVGPSKQLWEFQSLDEGQVSELIQKCSKKSCLSDPAPTSLVVSCLDELLPVITCLINRSMKIGYFPCDWKERLVTPLLKLPGLLSDFKNLRNVEVYHGKRIPLESKWQLIVGRLTRGSYKAKFSITALAVKTDSNEIFLAEIVLVIGAPFEKPHSG